MVDKYEPTKIMYQLHSMHEDGSAGALASLYFDYVRFRVFADAEGLKPIPGEVQAIHLTSGPHHLAALQLMDGAYSGDYCIRPTTPKHIIPGRKIKNSP